MALLYLLEFFFIVGFAWTVIFQLLIPLAEDRPLFPVFRWRKPANRLARVLDLQDLEAIEKEIRAQMQETDTCSQSEPVPLDSDSSKDSPSDS